MGPEHLSPAIWLLIAGIFLFAGLVHGILGLGFPMLATPLIAILFDVRSAILLTLLPTIAVNVVSILRGGRWSESVGRYWPLALVIPLGAIFGTWLLVRVDPAPFRLLLAAIIRLHLFNHRLRTIRLVWVHHRPRLAYLVFGLAAGFSAGAANTMVPLIAIYAMELGLSKLAMVQMFNLCFLAGKSAQMATFSVSGYFTLELLTTTLPWAAIGLVALLLGMRIRDRVDTETYQRWLRGVLWTTVVILTVQFFADVI